MGPWGGDIGLAGGAWSPRPAFPTALWLPWAAGIAAAVAPERRALVLLCLLGCRNVYFL